MAYEEDLFIKGGAKAILKHPKFEADDCIAISVKHLVKRYPDCTIYIITSDKDYLQLNSHNVNIYNLAFKNIAENKSSTGNAAADLEIKIIMGDTSDNIPSVFPKCGPKTAQKCIEDPETNQEQPIANISESLGILQQTFNLTSPEPIVDEKYVSESQSTSSSSSSTSSSPRSSTNSRSSFSSISSSNSRKSSAVSSITDPSYRSRISR
jgi:5'-3' exonuclease